jgi:hypothetical protein
MKSAMETPTLRMPWILPAVFALIGAIYLVDFLLYGRALSDAIAGVGYALMAYGMYKNGFAAEERNAVGRATALLGAALTIASIILRHTA